MDPTLLLLRWAHLLAALVAVYVHAGKSVAERTRIKSLTLDAASAASEALA